MLSLSNDTTYLNSDRVGVACSNTARCVCITNNDIAEL